jgi:hypothetical protein
VTAESIEKQDDDTLLKCLIDICESAPKFLRPQLDCILDLCMKVSWNGALWLVGMHGLFAITLILF